MASGIRVGVTAAKGYTSEALLETLEGEEVPVSRPRGAAFIIAAPGGRQALADGLTRLGWKPCFIMVYRSQPAALNPDAMAALADAAGLLSVWTSGNAMTGLSQRLPRGVRRQPLQ